MKVGLITPSVSRSAGGISEVVRQYAHSLSAIGDIELSVFALRDSFTNDDLHLWEPLSPRLFSTFGSKAFGFAPGLTDAMVKENLRICHLHILWMYTSIATMVWYFKKKLPYVITTHGFLEEWALNNSKFKKQLAAFFYEKNCLKNAACIHAFTESEYTSIRKYRLKNPVCVIPTGIQLPQTSCFISEAPWKSFVKSGEKVLLYIGRIHPKKGLVNLIHAWKKAKQKTSVAAWKLVIAGWDQNHHEAFLKQIVQAAGLENEVFLIGPQYNGQKESCFSHADAFVLPSFSEGLPVVVLEAWAFKLPVLMTPECHIPEGFQCEAALKIETNVPSIVSSLQTLFDMTEKQLEDMGVRGRMLVEKKFTLQQAAQSMHYVYRWLLGEADVPDTVIQK